MKKLALAVALMATGVMVVAQGTLNFANTPATVGGTGAPIFDVGGTVRLEGTGFAAEIYAGPNAGSLQPWGPILNFRTGGGAGFLVANTVATVVNNVVPGANAVVEIRAWQTGAGITSYETALAAGVKTGVSSQFTVKTGGEGSPPGLPANLVGMTSFSLVPEPTTYALALVGLGLLALRRRK